MQTFPQTVTLKDKRETPIDCRLSPDGMVLTLRIDGDGDKSYKRGIAEFLAGHLFSHQQRFPEDTQDSLGLRVINPRVVVQKSDNGVTIQYGTPVQDVPQYTGVGPDGFENMLRLSPEKIPENIVDQAIKGLSGVETGKDGYRLQMKGAETRTTAR